MKNVHRAKLVVLLSLVGLSVVGCWDKKEERIRTLYLDKQALMKTNEDLTGKLDKSEEKYAEAIAALDTTDAQLVMAKTEIVRLKADLVAAREAKGNGGNGGNGGTKPPDNRGGTWTIGGDVLFSSGQATVSADGRRELNRVIDTITRDYPRSSIRVYGHTDSAKIVKSKWKSNMHLSEARAEEVKRHMVARGIRRDNIQTIGMGDTNPVATNRTSTGRRRNRRVEIKVIRK